MTVKQQIAAIDKQIDAVRRAQIAETKSAVKRTHVFCFLHDCKKSAELLGFADLARQYEAALQLLQSTVAK